MKALTKTMYLALGAALLPAFLAAQSEQFYGTGYDLQTRSGGIYELRAPIPGNSRYSARNHDRFGNDVNIDFGGDDVWERPLLENSSDLFTPYYGHEFGIQRSKARRRASEERMDANRNKVRRFDGVAARAGMPRSYGPDVDPRAPILTIRGTATRGMDEEEAMWTVLGRDSTEPVLPERGELPPAPPTPEDDMQMLTVRDEVYYFRNGVFYMADGQDFVEVTPPTGARVFDLPEDTQRVDANGDRYYQYDGTWYRRMLVDGETVYEVAEEPVLREN